MDSYHTVQVAIVFAISFTSGLKSCNYEMHTLLIQNLFHIHSETIPVIGRQMQIGGGTDTPCYIDTEKMIVDYNFPEDRWITGIFKIVCLEHQKIHFSFSQNQTFFSKLIGYVQIMNCSFNSQNMDMFLGITNTYVLTLFNPSVLSESYFINSSLQGIADSSFQGTMHMSCCGFQNIVSFTLLNPQDVMQTINDIFNCSNEFVNMKEIIFFSCSGKVNQTLLREKFPDLQGMEIINCDYDGILQFPWSHEIAYVPFNLSRSEYLQNHYSESLHLDIPPNIFRRSLLIKNSSMVTSENLKMNGSLDYFKLSNAAIKKISKGMFENINGLQVLILSENNISDIETGAFSSLDDLTFLDLSLNQLDTLPVTLFEIMTQLRVLNLRHNRLKSLPSKIFSMLNSLVDLDLNHNEITVVDDKSLPHNSVNLRNIHLDYNPVKQFPVSVFYIRNLNHITLRYSNISFKNLTKLIENIDIQSLIGSVNPSSSSLDNDVFKTSSNWRVADLTGCNITGFSITGNISKNFRKLLLLILKHFKFVLKNNPITCSSDIVPFIEIMQSYQKDGHWTGEEYFYSQWLCEHPHSLHGRPVLKINKTETYDALDHEKCPSYCTCYFRTYSNVTIVDCRNGKLSKLPKAVPPGIIDMWMENNNISILNLEKYLPEVRQLILSNNSLKIINPDIFDRMQNLKVLKLDRNFLIHIPKNIVKLNLEELCLEDNPLQCDCKSMWMKLWMKNNIRKIRNLKSVLCLNERKDTHRFLDLPDYKFTCEDKALHMHFTKPIAAGITILFVIGILIFLLYAYWHEIKVFIYLRCECHPFDRGKQAQEHESVHLTIFHANDMDTFVHDSLILPISERNYVVNSSKDFIAGYSIQENISLSVYHSKHILLVLSEEMLLNTSVLSYIWSESQEKIKRIRSNFLIVTSVIRINKNTNLNPNIYRYLKIHKQINHNSFLLRGKILYILSSYRRDTTAGNSSDTHINVFSEARGLILTPDASIKNAIFVCYSDDERQYCQTNLIPRLEKESFQVSTPDSHFHPGISVLTNAIQTVADSKHTIFVTSSVDSTDQIQCIVFQQAFEKTRLQKDNHLILINLSNQTFLGDNDVGNYMKSYVFLNARDEGFFSKLKRAILSSKTNDSSTGTPILNSQVNSLELQDIRPSLPIVTHL